MPPLPPSPAPDSPSGAHLSPSSPSLLERLGGRDRVGILVRNFYSTLAIHPVLGPIFAEHIDDWPTHYATLTDFWCVQTGGPEAAAYRGRLIQAHRPLKLRGEHFELWLARWRHSCGLHFAEPEAAELVALAERLGARMRESLEGGATPGR